MDIRAALQQLDPSNDEHWTQDGLPRTDVMQKLTGRKNLTRQEITAADETFSREVAIDRRMAALEQAEGGQDAPPPVVPPAPPAPPTHPAAPPPVEAKPDTDDSDLGDVAGVVQDDPPRSVLAIPLPKVLASYELCSLALEELSAMNDELIKERAKLQKEIDANSARIEALERRRVQLERRRPKDGSIPGMREYLQGQQRIREDRAKRLAAFLGGSGVGAREVAKAIAPLSPIDQALRTRRPTQQTPPPQRPPAS